jgi:hypothetical protein
LLPLAELVFNNLVLASTGFSPVLTLLFSTCVPSLCKYAHEGISGAVGGGLSLYFAQGSGFVGGQSPTHKRSLNQLFQLAHLGRSVIPSRGLGLAALP